jgi:hypothetical protein
VNLPLPDFDLAAAVEVLTPSGAKLAGWLIGASGQAVMHLSEATEMGTYRAQGEGKTHAFVVNASRADSPLRGMDAKTLEAWWAPASVEIVSMEAAMQQLQQPSNHWPLWPALIALAGLLLLAETVYVHRLCPRANPKPADAVVPRRGVMRPINSEASPT